jgi:hypothetical protein
MRVLIDAAVLDALARRVLDEVECACALEWRVEPGDVVRVHGHAEPVRGDESSVRTPSAPATAHTHTIGNYERQRCFVGWPSGEDMRWIFEEACGGAFLLHVCVALEGSYAVTVNPAVRGLEPRDAEALRDDVYRYFSSRHGHRCGAGAEAERYPCALYFIRLASEYRFDGPMCEQHAGEAAVCEAPSAARRRAAGVVAGPVFAARFVPHELALREEGAAPVRYGDLVAAPAAHRARVAARAYRAVAFGGGGAAMRATPARCAPWVRAWVAAAG